MSAKARIRTKLPKFPSRDTWSAAWQKHWSKVGLPGYELPVGWFSSIAPSKPRVVLTHGEDGPREALAKKIQQRFNLTSKRPGMGDVVEL